MKLTFVVATTPAFCECCGGSGRMVQKLVLTPGKRPWRCKPVQVACPHCGPQQLPLLVGAR